MVANTDQGQALCGWTPNPGGVRRWLRDPSNRHPNFATAAGVQHAQENLRPKSGKRLPTVLYPALFQVMPDWYRGAQGIGDCVSWGWELACTLMLARMAVMGQIRWEAPAATESIYGGSRVEARGQRSGGWSDGSYGGAAAKWVSTAGGVLLRRDYSKETGNAEHDLRKYDSGKAKNWGNYGNGGQSDKGALDLFSTKTPIRTTSLITSAKDAADAIELFKVPIPVCSNYGFASKRDRDGFVRRQGSWSHCMLLAGVRYSPRPGFLLVNSWGHSWSGPHWPLTMPEEFAACSAWIEWNDADGILKQRDSYAVSPVDGFTPEPEFDGMFGLAV